MLLYDGSDSDEFTDEHEGWVAGRFPDGSLSDIWTDARGFPARTFSAYLPRCECGWVGPASPVSPAGHRLAVLRWRMCHLAKVIAGRPARRALPEPVCLPGGFVPER